MGNKKRSSFTGKLGFVLAAAGSAVGLGNIWRFPYLAAKYGGGIFLLVYIILALTFGFALMTAEIAIGRKTGLSAIGAFQKLSKKYTFIGYGAAVIPAIILPYYSVIGGWVMKYMSAFLSGGKSVTATATEGYFGNFISSNTDPVMWFLLFMGITALVVLFGVEKGIEKVSKVMMPILVALSIFIAIYVVCQPGAMAGVKYYIVPDFSHFSVKTVLAAMGQLFYSMSLAMGIMITYGSYMRKEDNIEKSVRHIEIFDTAIAFLSGMMIVPAVYAISGEEAMSAGPSLMFITLPNIFEKMAGGRIIGTVFFILVLLAALTSSISLMETIVSIICEKFKIKRAVCCFIVLGFSFVLGLVSVFGYSIWSAVTVAGMQFLDFFDYISNNIMMPIVALLTCILIGFFVKTKFIESEVELTSQFKSKKMYRIMVKFVAPLFMVVILVSSLLGVV